MVALIVQKTGFKVNRKGWLYVLVSEDVRGCSAGEEFVQFGISGSLKSRLESHRAYGFGMLRVLLLEGRGRVVWDVERLLKDFWWGQVVCHCCRRVWFWAFWWFG